MSFALPQAMRAPRRRYDAVLLVVLLFYIDGASAARLCDEHGILKHIRTFSSSPRLRLANTSHLNPSVLSMDKAPCECASPM
eukprot:4067489-Lingulodinium_polyedra.AAC.1